MDRDTTSVRRVGQAALLVLTAYASGVAALLLAAQRGTTPAWWPAAGVGLLAMVVVPRRHRPLMLAALVVAYVAANLTGGRPVGAAFLLGSFDAVETGISALVLGRLLPRLRLEGVQDGWKLFAASCAGAVVAAIGIAGTLSGTITDGFWSTTMIVVAAHVASVMLVTPLAMIRWRRPPLPRVELTVQVLLLVVATAIAFGPVTNLTLGFAPLPVLVWAAVRFDERVIAVEQAAYAVAVTLLTSAGWGPFNLQATVSGSSGSNSTQLAQLYLVCLVLVGLPLSQAMRERERAMALVSASERVFRRNFTESHVPVALVRWDGTRLEVSEVNAATSALLGRPAAELVGLAVPDLLTGAELPEVLEGTGPREVIGWSGTLGLVGSPRTTLHAILSLLEQGDRAAYFSLQLQDVTESAELQETLQAQQRYTRAVIDTASSALLVTDSTGTVVAANPATDRLTGYSEAEMLGRRFWDVVMPEGLRAQVGDLFASTRTIPRHGETSLRTKAGEIRTVVYTIKVHQDSAQDPVQVVLSATDVTEARESAGMVDHVLRSITTIAFVGTDVGGRITLFNTGAERMLGLRAEDARGRHLVDFLEVAPDHTLREQEPAAVLAPVTFADLVARSGAELSPETRDWTLRPEGRAPLRVSMSTNPIPHSSGQVTAFLFVARDVTDTRRSQEILVNALRRERQVVARLKELDAAKDDFVSTVSHELRTPMSSIIGSAEMLHDGILGDLLPEQQSMVEVISRNGDRLLNLADDLLVLATFDHGSWPEQAEPVDLREVVQQSSDAVATLVDSRDLALHFALPDEALLVRGDVGHLERAVTNLLTNAVKFTPDGGRVEVRLDVDAAGRSAVLEVEDTGIGIPADDLESVFGRFYRSSVVQERAIQGSGLGLSIVKAIVESHDGRIAVRSRLGQGTTFTMTLPLTLSAARGADRAGRGEGGVGHARTPLPPAGISAG